VRLVALGIDHTKAPAALREAVAMPQARVAEALQKLRGTYGGHEFVIISTCNRVEIFAATEGDRLQPGQPMADGPQLTRFLAEFHRLKPAELQPHVSVYHDDGVVGHLFRVSSSVESLVLGEGQILGQVREAYQQAVAAHSVGWLMHTVFQHALKVGKKVRETTGLGVGKLSVASVAVDVARDVFDHFQDKTVLVIGAGEMAELALTLMTGLKPGRVLVVNRSLERGQQLAEQFGGTAWEYSKLNQALIEADLIVSTTASSEVIVDLETFARVQRARRYRLALILDIAIPRDFDDRIGQLDQVMLYNVDDLKSQVERNMAQRRGGLNAAHQLIETETAACMAALRHQRHAANVLKELGDHADRLREAELKQLFERLGGLSEKDRKEIERMAHRLQNQLLHEPRAALRSSAKLADDQHLSLPAAVGRLFGLGGGWSYRRRSVRVKTSQMEMESVDEQAKAELGR
jgi:glutamyl-tRNA reductase